MLSKLSKRLRREGMLSAMGLGLLISSGASAEPASSQQSVPVQKSPAVLRLQAAVTQAKLPLGDAVFNNVYLKVRSGGQVVWERNLGKQQVRNGVINLEFPGVDDTSQPPGSTGGTSVGPALDDVIARSSDLKLLVCIEDRNNCLSEVPIAAVPLAVKATHAYQANTANHASEASLCDYTYGATAASRVYGQTQTLDFGRIEFSTPTDAQGKPKAKDRTKYASTIALATAPQSDAAGFVKWKPATAGASELHLCAADASDLVQPLERLVLHATQTIVDGALVVPATSRLNVAGDAELIGNNAIGATGKTTAFAGAVDFSKASVSGLDSANNGLTAFKVGAPGATSTLQGNLNFAGSTATDLSVNNFTATGSAVGIGAGVTYGGVIAVTQGGTTLRIDSNEIDAPAGLYLNHKTGGRISLGGVLNAIGGSDVVGSTGACTGGAITTTIGGGSLCMDSDEIQTRTPLFINNETKATTTLGPVRVEGDLEVTGKVGGIKATSPVWLYSVDSKNYMTTMVGTKNSYCFLTSISIRAAGGFCTIFESDGKWTLTNASLGGISPAVCNATCLTWGPQ